MRGKRMIMPKQGQVYNGITFLEETERGSAHRRFGNFKCHCGTNFNTWIYTIVKGLTKGCGCKNGTWNRRLTDNQVLVIRHMVWNEQKTLREIAEKFNVSIGTIYYIKIEKTHKRVA